MQPARRSNAKHAREVRQTSCRQVRVQFEEEDIEEKSSTERGAAAEAAAGGEKKASEASESKTSTTAAGTALTTVHEEEDRGAQSESGRSSASPVPKKKRFTKITTETTNTRIQSTTLQQPLDRRSDAARPVRKQSCTAAARHADESEQQDRRELIISLSLLSLLFLSTFSPFRLVIRLVRLRVFWLPPTVFRISPIISPAWHLLLHSVLQLPPPPPPRLQAQRQRPQLLQRRPSRAWC